MIGAGHDRFAAGAPDGGRDLITVGCDDHLAAVGGNGALPDVHDHRPAMDIGKRLARQSGCLHPGRNHNQVFEAALVWRLSYR